MDYSNKRSSLLLKHLNYDEKKFYDICHCDKQNKKQNKTGEKFPRPHVTIDTPIYLALLPGAQPQIFLTVVE